MQHRKSSPLWKEGEKPGSCGCQPEHSRSVQGSPGRALRLSRGNQSAGISVGKLSRRVRKDLWETQGGQHRCTLVHTHTQSHKHSDPPQTHTPITHTVTQTHHPHTYIHTPPTHSHTHTHHTHTHVQSHTHSHKHFSPNIRPFLAPLTIHTGVWNQSNKTDNYRDIKIAFTLKNKTIN